MSTPKHWINPATGESVVYLPGRTLEKRLLGQLVWVETHVTRGEAEHQKDIQEAAMVAVAEEGRRIYERFAQEPPAILTEEAWSFEVWL